MEHFVNRACKHAARADVVLRRLPPPRVLAIGCELAKVGDLSDPTLTLADGQMVKSVRHSAHA